ncbi:hypothetical protein YC2023_017990 [Brassica napus]
MDPPGSKEAHKIILASIVAYLRGQTAILHTFASSRGARKANKIKHEDPQFLPSGLIKPPHPPNPKPRQDSPSEFLGPDSYTPHTTHETREPPEMQTEAEYSYRSSTSIWGMSRSITLYEDIPSFSIKPSGNSDQSLTWGKRLIHIKEKKKVLQAQLDPTRQSSESRIQLEIKHMPIEPCLLRFCMGSRTFVHSPSHTSPIRLQILSRRAQVHLSITDKEGQTVGEKYSMKRLLQRPASRFRVPAPRSGSMPPVLGPASSVWLPGRVKLFHIRKYGRFSLSDVFHFLEGSRIQGPSLRFHPAGTRGTHLPGIRGSESCLEAGGNNTGIFFPNSLPLISRLCHQSRGITCTLESTGVVHSKKAPFGRTLF